MKTPKTRRVYAGASLNGEDRIAVIHSIVTALDALDEVAEAEGRDVLWDTTDLSINQIEIDQRTLSGEGEQKVEFSLIEVSALAVLK